MSLEAEDIATADQSSASAVRRGVLAVSLGVITLALGVSGIGLIPVPNSTGNATVMHIPVILGGVFGGPFAGMAVGLVFGGFSWLDHSAPIFRDPVVSIVPRTLIGLISWMAFVALKDRSMLLAAALAGVFGSFANTAGVLFLAITLGYFPASAVIPVLPQATVEAVLASLALILAVWAWAFYGRRTAPGTSGAEEPGDSPHSRS